MILMVVQNDKKNSIHWQKLLDLAWMNGNAVIVGSSALSYASSFVAPAMSSTSAAMSSTWAYVSKFLW
jgi:hypothetical protein